ncbi:hypothetical protein Tco_1054273 [Tanacetum coccineum]|uniref:Uncharacterized protein n=1 Tax=Tanacetum coccineum TaxID=301880 RepID=A0ABQ5GXJ2_9ASTR
MAIAICLSYTVGEEDCNRGALEGTSKYRESQEPLKAITFTIPAIKCLTLLMMSLSAPNIYTDVDDTLSMNACLLRKLRCSGEKWWTMIYGAHARLVELPDASDAATMIRLVGLCFICDIDNSSRGVVYRSTVSARNCGLCLRNSRMLSVPPEWNLVCYIDTSDFTVTLDDEWCEREDVGIGYYCINTLNMTSNTPFKGQAGCAPLRGQGAEPLAGVPLPGPTGIVQAAKLCKIAAIWEGGEDFVMSTQEYIRKVIEDDDFTRWPWLSVVEFVNVDGGGL